MDKDMERLGTERLKRVKRRKRLAVFIVSMAVLVLSATIYRLIQPASAMDQDQADITVDGETLAYKNLAKLSSPPEIIVDGEIPVEWNIDNSSFEFSVQMTFSISKDECKDANGNINNNYYMAYGEDITIPDSLCDKWRQYTDEYGTDTCVYRFVKNDDGTFAVLIKFNDGYLDSSTSTVSAGVGFNASGYGETKEDGTVVIKIGGDAVLEIDKEYINWDKKDSLHYDISVKKSNTTSNTLSIDENGKYAEYVVDVSSEKGTPDVISMNDVLKAGRMSVDTSKFTYTITKNGQSAGNEYTAAVVADENNDDNNHNYTLSATLPKLEAGESCQITYKYYYDTSLCYNAAPTWAVNNVTVESINKDTLEKVVDRASSTISYTRNDLDKQGEYDKENQVIKWVITVNKERNDIVGAKVTDEMLKDAINFAVTSDQDTSCKGMKVEYGEDGKISGITFNEIGNGKNDSTYVITYETKAYQKYNDYWVYNRAVFKKDVELNKDVTITVPGSKWDVPLTKELKGDVDEPSESRYKLTWQTSFTIPQGGVDKGATFSDELTSSVGDSTTHYMTYAQIKKVFDHAKELFGDHITNLKVKSGDTDYDWNKLSSDTDMKFRRFSFEFKDAYAPENVGKEGMKVTFDYESYADYSAGGEMTYKNTSKFCDVDANAEFKSKKDVKSKITKTNGKGVASDTTIKTTDKNYDGTLIWIVSILMDKNSTKYTVTDTMPQGVSVKNVQLELQYNNENSRYDYPSLDGKTYDVDNSSGSLYCTAGVRTSSEKTTDGDHEVITTVIEKPNGKNIPGWHEGSTIYLIYKCNADSAESLADGESLTYKNTAKAKSDKNDDIGEASQIQIITKPKNQDSEKPDQGEKVITKNGSWDDDQHKLNYTVIINPSAQTYLGEGKTLNLKDILTYSKRSYNDTDARWQIDILPGTVKFREAIKQSDGTYKAGDNVSGCTWTYSSDETANDWQSSVKTINAVIPDGKAIMLTYTYTVKADILSAWGDGKPRFNVSNTVSLEGIDKSNTETKTEIKYTKAESSFFAYKNNTYVLFKTKAGDFSKVLPGAEFELYKYDSDSTDPKKTADGYVPAGKYVTDGSGKIEISYDAKTMSYNTQYYVVETKAPDGYVLPDKPPVYMFYFASPDTSKYPVSAPGELAGVSLANSYSTEYVEDEAVPTTSITVNKVWQNSDGHSKVRKEGSIYIRLHQIDENGQDKVYGDDVEITPDSSGNWSYSFTNLPKNPVDENGKLTKDYNYKYYVEEVGVDNKNDLSGYTTSYIYTDQNGTAYGDINSGNTSKNAIESGTVEITNKENAYALPETGGSGNRWIYMLSGFVLVLVAGISLFYKHNKQNI